VFVAQCSVFTGFLQTNESDLCLEEIKEVFEVIHMKELVVLIGSSPATHSQEVSFISAATSLVCLVPT